MGVGIGVDAVADGSGWIGRSALDDRLIELGRYQSLGIIRGCKVNTSSSAMRYTVGSGSAPVSLAVSSRGGADGATTFVVPAGTLTTGAAPASGSRIDVVWAKQNRPDLGDADNQVVLGVTQGASAASPVKPTIPTGAVTLAVYEVPAGVTNTNGATKVDVGRQAVPYGAAKGVLLEYIHTANEAAIPAGPLIIVNKNLALGSPRKLNFQLTACAKSMDTSSEKTVLAMQLRIDGVERREISFTLDKATGVFQYSEFEELEAGNHAIQVRALMTNGTGRFMYSVGRWPGQKLVVVDNGVDDG